MITYNTNGNVPQKLFNNRFIPKIIPGAIYTIDQLVTEDVQGIRETLDARHMVLSKEIVQDAAHSGAHIFRTLREVSRTDRDGSTPQGVNTAVATARLTPPIKIFNGTSNSPTRTRTQDIFNPIRPASPQCISNAQQLKNSINDFLTKIAVLEPVSVK